MFRSCLVEESPLFLICAQILLVLFNNNVWIITAVVCSVVMLFYFYRVPDRPRVKAPYEVILSPSDGTVMEIQQKKNGYLRVVIYLSPFDVHQQWYPTYGVVVDRRYVPGQFNLAYLTQKSQYNERVSTVIRNEYGIVRVDQIAGQLARRIVNYATLHTLVRRGEHMGMIKLSSRVDIHLPSESVKLHVEKGDKVFGNQTKIATWI